MKRCLLLLACLALTGISSAAFAQITPTPGSAAAFVFKPGRAAVAVNDIEPPEMHSGPTVNVTSSTTATLSVAIKENGTGYYLIQPAATAAPTVDAVRSGASFTMTANVVSVQDITGLTGSTSYKLYFVARDTSNNVQTIVRNFAFSTPADTQPPLTSMPLQLLGKSDTAATFSVGINENGTGYYIVKLASESAPTATTVRDTGTPVAMLADTAVNITLSGLVGNTNYKVYFVAKDTSNNLQSAPSNLLFTTDPDSTPPNTTDGPSVSGTSSTGTTLSATIDENGTGYAWVRLATAAEPGVSEVVTNGVNFAMTAVTAANRSITGLSASTDYKIYFVAKDASNNFQSAVQNIAFTTSAGTFNCNANQSTNPVGACCPAYQNIHKTYDRATTLDFVTFKAQGSGATLTNCSLSTCNLQKTAANYWVQVASCP